MISSEKLRILLDSTYLLPIIGIDIENTNEVLFSLKKLRDEEKAEYYYTQFSLLEILGKLTRIRYDRERVAAGLTSIMEEFKPIYPTVEGYLKALALRTRGYRDLIDLLLYTTSLTTNTLFLTRDYNLVEFLKRNQEDVGSILLEKKFLEKYI